MPPSTALRPSTTSSLRWSRWLTSQPALAASGLTGLNSTHVDAGVGCRRLKYAFGVPSVPTLSWIRLTWTPSRLLGDEGVGEAPADVVVLEDVGLHVDAVARAGDRVEHAGVGVRARSRGGRRGCRAPAGCRRAPARARGGAPGRRCRSPPRQLRDQLLAALGRQDAAAGGLELHAWRIGRRHVGRDHRQRAATGKRQGQR